jgi:predicted nucleic acid-binding Zn ribbon protein
MAKHNEPDRLSREATLAIAAGMSYGKWKAMQPLIDIPTDTISEGRTRACQRCGKPFPLNNRGAGVKKFCSDECREKFYVERKSQMRKQHKTCPVCGKTFVADNNHQKYCGMDCYRLVVAERAKQYKQRRKERMRDGNNQVL